MFLSYQKSIGLAKKKPPDTGGFFHPIFRVLASWPFF